MDKSIRKKVLRVQNALIKRVVFAKAVANKWKESEGKVAVLLRW